MHALKKAKLVTGICFGITAMLLGSSIVVFASSPNGANAGQPEDSGITIGLDSRTYDGLMGFLDYYADREAYEQPAPEPEPVGAKLLQDGDGSYYIVIGDQSHQVDDPSVEIVTGSDGKLYVIIDGKVYPLDDTGDVTLQDILGYSGNGESNVHGYDDNGNPIIGYDEEGNPIIGYDEEGNPILGYRNPRIRVDVNGNKYYHIVWGDTLCKISSDLHISVDELAEYNHIRNVHLIWAESDLRIPEGDWSKEELIQDDLPDGQ